MLDGRCSAALGATASMASILGKRSLEHLQGFFLDLVVTRFGAAFPTRRDVHAAEMAGEDDHWDNAKYEVSQDVYDLEAYLGNTIELRARPGTLVGRLGYDGELNASFAMAKHVSAVYEAPNGKSCFSTRDLCSILRDFSPAEEAELLGHLPVVCARLGTLQC